MIFRLGTTDIKAINDGGIRIRCSSLFLQGRAVWGLHGDTPIKPVLSFEVIPALILHSLQTKRKGSKGKPADWKHAGQIFCEMLGHVCHPEFYDTIEQHEYLEVIITIDVSDCKAFVIHVRHTTASIFYCNFPVSYLRNIAKHGAGYRTKVPSPQGVHLQHSQPYYLRDPDSRAGFFRIIARVLWYLSSGKSHVPYLWNRADNPINTVSYALFAG
jgi:hypothetical protein